MTEHKWIKKVILPYLKQQGAVIYNKQRGNVYEGSGIADLHVTHRVWTGWLEIKGVNTRVTPAQRLFLGKRFYADPGSVFILRLGRVADESQILAPNGRFLKQFDGGTCKSLLAALGGVYLHVNRNLDSDVFRKRYC